MSFFWTKICRSLELVCHRSVLRETVRPVDTFFLLLFVSSKNAIRATVHSLLIIVLIIRRKKSAANSVYKKNLQWYRVTPKHERLEEGHPWVHFRSRKWACLEDTLDKEGKIK